MANFEKGKVYMTATINNTISDNTEFAKEITNAMSRYNSCDWGDLCGILEVILVRVSELVV